MTVSKTFFPAFIITCLLTLASCGGSNSAQNNNAPSSSEQNTTPLSIQQVMDKAVRDGVDGISVFVQKKDQEGTSYVSGLQNKENGILFSSDSLFKVASISKLFIAVSVAKLAESGELILDDTLAQWLPDIAENIENSDSITIRLMVQHRSGIPDFDSQTGFGWNQSHTDLDLTLSYALNKPADFSPNDQYSYSNTNYLLIGKILDKALGYSHQTFIEQTILSPLLMHNTYPTIEHAINAGVIGTSKNDETFVTGYWSGDDKTALQYLIPGGSFISNAEDIGLFMRALNTGDLLTDNERDIYTSLYSFNHSGWLPGYQSVAFYQSDLDTVVIQLINNTGGQSEQIADDSLRQIVNSLK